MQRLRQHGVQVIAKAYDNPIPGYGTATVGNLRLWEALPVTELNLSLFNEGKFSEVRFLTSCALCSCATPGMSPFLGWLLPQHQERAPRVRTDQALRSQLSSGACLYLTCT